MFNRIPLFTLTALLLLGGARTRAFTQVNPQWTTAPTEKAASTTSVINPGNILVSVGNILAGSGTSPNFVREFTPAGTLVQTIPFNYNNGSYPGTEYLRDIVVDRDGSIAGFNGTFSPFLTRYSSVSGTFTHNPFAGWSTVNNTFYGGIAAYQNYIFVTDAFTSGGEPNGIIRFDTATNTALRFASGSDFADLNIGLDGNLYALTSQTAPIRVYDPTTLALLRQIPLPTGIPGSDSIKTLAVDQAGRLFVCGNFGTVYRLSSSGALEASEATGFFSISDMDIDETGRLILGQQNGRVLLGDSTLTNPFTSFTAISDPNALNWTIFVSFARPLAGPSPGPTPTPTPTPSATPTPNPSCPSTITQSTSQVITAGNSASCNTGSPGYYHHDTSYWRAFNMSSFNNSRAYDITSVSFGIDTARSGSGAGQPLTVRLYANNGGAFPGGSRTPIASVNTTVTDQAQTILSVPISVTVPAGTSELVMEVFTPDGVAASNSFFIGSNTATQTGPSYASSGTCGNPTPTDTAVIGFPNMHIVFNVNGSCKAAPPSSARTLNMSTRLRVETGDNAMIGGFIVTGNAPKSVVVRGMGPSLAKFGITDYLSDPVLALRAADGTPIFQNDNWKASPQKSQIEGTTFQPTDDRESVLLVSVAPGNYTAILTGAGQTTGTGLVEVYDTGQAADSQLSNISTRGSVQAGNNVMIGGFILGGNNGSTRIAIRGLGPSLSQSGLSNVLADPTLELHDSNGTTLSSNNNWQDDPASAAQLIANGLDLKDSLESGIFTTLPPGSFTAILAGKDGGIGLGLVEIYNLR